MNSQASYPSENDLENLSLVLKQFDTDIYELRQGQGNAKQVFGRDEHSIFESASTQANKLLELCNHDLVIQLLRFKPDSAENFLYELRTLACFFLRNVQFKYASLSESEENTLDYLMPRVKEYLDLVQSASFLTQSNRTPLVILRGQDEEPIVCGKNQKKLTVQQYKVVKALYESDSPLSKDKLIEKSNCTDAVNILKRVAKKPDWEKVIQLAGTPGVGYSIKR